MTQLTREYNLCSNRSNSLKLEDDSDSVKKKCDQIDDYSDEPQNPKLF